VFVVAELGVDPQVRAPPDRRGERVGAAGDRLAPFVEYERSLPVVLRVGHRASFE